MNLENRTVPYQAMTDHEEELPVGTEVIVVTTIDWHTVKVAPRTDVAKAWQVPNGQD